MSDHHDQPDAARAASPSHARAFGDADAHLRELLELTAALGGASTLDEAARLLVERGIAAVGASAGSLSMLDASAATFQLLYARGLPSASVQAFRQFPLRPGRPLSDAVTSSRGVFLPDRTAWETHYPEMAAAIHATGAGALAVIPVSTTSGAIAGLSLAWPTSLLFDEPTRDFLSTLGALCGHAIERARLADSERASRAEADAAIAQLQEQATELEQALDQARTLTRELADSVARAEDAARLAEQASAIAAESERLFRVAANAAPVMIWTSRADGGCDWFNDPWLAFTGRPLERQLGERWVEGVHPDDRDRCVAEFADACLARWPIATEYRLRRHDGAYRWVLDSAVPRFAEDGEFLGYVGSALDVTEQHDAAARERILARLGGALADSLADDDGLREGDGWRGHDPTLQRLVDVIVPDLADWCVIDIIEPGSDAADAPLVGRRAAMAHADPALRTALQEMADRYPPDPARPTLGRVATATGRAQLIATVTDELLHSVAHDAAQVALGRRLGMRSAIIVPLSARGVSEGVAVFVSAAREYGADDLALAEEVGRRAALAIDNARLLRALERERAELATVLAVAPVGIGIARDPGCRQVRVNPAFARQLGVTLDANASLSAPDARTLPFRVMSRGQEVPPEELPMQIAAREGRLVGDVELDIVHDDGRVTRLLEYAAPLLDRFDRPRGAVGAFVDITERAALVEAERAARATAEEASSAKTHLLSTLSHELRTPVNSVLAHAQLIEMGLHGPVTDEQREALSRIHRSAQHLTGLITDLLNLARIEQGRITYDLRPVPVAETLAALAGLLAPQAAEKALALVVDPIPGASAVIADPDRLQQILLNLVGNAIKFTEGGGRVTLGAASDGGAVRIIVADTGRGIPADHLDVIFDRFVQVDPALTRRAGGMGLGLSISRDLARGMGGELSVESTSGVGSTFTLTLPGATEA